MISEGSKYTVDKYVSEGIHPGHFIYAVLENDLFGAVSRADANSRRELADIVIYIYNNIPVECYGNRQKVNAWMNKKYREYESAKGAKGESHERTDQP